MINFSEGIELPNRFSGSEKKKTIEIQGKRYLVKFPDPTRTSRLEVSYINNVYSEFIGSQIFKSVGIPTQETVLGTYTLADGREKLVCGCEDFNSRYYQLVEFNNLMISNIDAENLDTNDPEVIENSIRMNPSIENPEEEIKKFWDMFIVDALIGNTDRHNANWGFMENILTHKLSFAPIYDCGSSLFPLKSDESISEVMKSDVELKNQFQNVYSCLRKDNRRINYSSFLAEGKNMNCNQAIVRIFPSINLKFVAEILDTVPNLHPDRRAFYHKAIQYRYEKILKPAYNKLIKREKKKEPEFNRWGPSR